MIEHHVMDRAERFAWSRHKPRLVNLSKLITTIETRQTPFEAVLRKMIVTEADGATTSSNVIEVKPRK